MDAAPTENTSSDSSTFRWQSAHLVYGIVMFLILLFGFFGNLFTLIVLRQREHRKKSVSPLMMNLAIADLCMVVLGYPPVMGHNLTGNSLHEGSSICVWAAFINSLTGMVSIASLTGLSVVVYQTVKRKTPQFGVPRRQSVTFIAVTWFYGFFTTLPPLFGWNRFIPGQSGFSCAPDWTASDGASLAYTVFLVTIGFFIPLILMGVFHYLIHRKLKRQLSNPSHSFVQAQRELYQRKLVHMTLAVIGTFLLSWTPYCFVSLAGMFRGSHVLTPGEAELPELMAKASVIYNPIVYTVMSQSFRRTFWGIISGSRDSLGIEETRTATINVNYSTPGGQQQSVI